MYLYILIAFIIAIFLYNWLNLVEGLENKDDSSCVSDTKTMIYQNNGAIKNLQTQFNQMMQDFNNLLKTDAKQTAGINENANNIKKNETIAQAADKLSKENKQSLLKIVNGQKQKAEELRKNAAKLAPIK